MFIFFGGGSGRECEFFFPGNTRSIATDNSYRHALCRLSYVGSGGSGGGSGQTFGIRRVELSSLSLCQICFGYAPNAQNEKSYLRHPASCISLMSFLTVSDE